MELFKALLAVYFIYLVPGVIEQVYEKETDKINRGQTGGGDNEP